jgi:hypothetical protein
MISVEFRSIGSGTCMWCRKEKEEVLHVSFSDKSFNGPLCKADFFKALGTKVGPASAPPSLTAVPVSNGNP